MQLEEYHHYIIEPGTAAYAAYEVAAEARRAAFAEANDYAKSLGALCVLHYGKAYNVTIFLADPETPAPRGIRVLRDQQYRDDDGSTKTGVAWVPDRRIKAGKEIDSRLRSFRIPTVFGGFAKATGCPMHDRMKPAGGGKCWLIDPDITKAGDVVVLSLPTKKDEPRPEIEGCRPVRPSDVMRLIEDADAARRDAA